MYIPYMSQYNIVDSTPRTSAHVPSEQLKLMNNERRNPAYLCVYCLVFTIVSFQHVRSIWNVAIHSIEATQMPVASGEYLNARLDYFAAWIVRANCSYIQNEPQKRSDKNVRCAPQAWTKHDERTNHTLKSILRLCRRHECAAFHLTDTTHGHDRFGSCGVKVKWSCSRDIKSGHGQCKIDETFESLGF